MTAKTFKQIQRDRYNNAKWQLDFLRAEVKQLEAMRRALGNVDTCECCLSPNPEHHDGYTLCCNELHMPVDELIERKRDLSSQWREQMADAKRELAH